MLPGVQRLSAEQKRLRLQGVFKMGVKQLWVLFLLTSATAFVGRADGSLAPALFILGDSTVDTGNQNYITSIIKSNYPPYGMDFVPPGPTGRFSNGKLANDFIAEYLGLPYPVNSLSPSATGSALLTGVNLASSGSGYLDSTGQVVGVRNFSRQLDDFVVVQASIIQQIGQPAALDLFKNSIFIVSTGTNDFLTYDLNPISQQNYSPQQYQQLVLDVVASSLKTLYGYGARKLVIDSLPPVGCAPEQLNMYNSKTGQCLENVNAPLRNFNQGLVQVLADLRSEYPDYQLLYANVYDFLLDLFLNPTNYGFVYGNTLACCGEGAYKGLPCINPISDVCSDVDQYVFWDLFHPSQKAYQMLANNVIYGDVSQISPNNLQGVV